MKTAVATAEAIRAGQTSALAECDAAIARIEAANDALNAVVVRDFDRARDAARAIDARIAAGDTTGALLGVPMTVKESYNVAGLRTTWGFAQFRDFVAREDAVAVARLKRAGAVILGKTNVPVALADVQSVNPNYGRTNNAVDPSRVAGGSSGGSAVALASGMVAIEMGSDIGGSIRVPAAFNGVWGLKPSYGALPMDGHFFPGTQGAPVPLSVIGPMARDADDLAALLDIVADLPLPPAPDKPVAALRVLVLREHPLARAQSSILGTLDAVADALAAAGAHVERGHAPLPDLEAQHRDYMHLLNVVMTARMPAQPDRAPTTLVDWLGLLDRQAACRRAWGRAFGTYDAVIAPTFGTVAFAHDDTPLPDRKLTIDGDVTEFGAQFAYPGLATFPMLPAASVPIARDADGMPIGLQVITDFHRDHQAIRIARTVQTLIKERQQ